MGKIKDISNQRFGRLFVMSFAGMKFSKSGSVALWNCICDCGNESVKIGTELRYGSVQSCGCWHDESAKYRATTHGKSGGLEYSSWSSMIARCTNENSPDFSNYGGRGIKVCDRWLNSFENFFLDMGIREPAFTIDRYPDKNGNYEPGNCRWATQPEQCLNTRSNRMISYNGITLPMAEMCRMFKINDKVFSARIGRLKWPINIALETPVVRGQKLIGRLA